MNEADVKKWLKGRTIIKVEKDGNIWALTLSDGTILIFYSELIMQGRKK